MTSLTCRLSCHLPEEDAEESAANGKLTYESAAMYIRRKNRERRARTLTIAITEEAWQRWRDL